MHWGTMSSIEHVYWIISVVASTVLAVQLIIACISGVEIHMGSDFGGHDVGHHDIGEPHFQLLTIRSIVAFFALFGWSGLAFYHQNFSLPLVIILSSILGLAMMFVTAGCFYLLSKLQSEGTMNLNNAKGLQATVYLVVPATGCGAGKITVALQGRYVEMEALNTSAVEIPTGSTVIIKEVANSKAIVERVEA